MSVVPHSAAVAIDAHKLRQLLAESLAMWGIEGVVEACEAPCVARVRIANGASMWIEPAPAHIPFRWLVHHRPADTAHAGARAARPRPCSSVVGILNAMRNALNVDRGSAIRISAAGDVI